MADAPYFSIVIPTFNRAALLPRVLESVAGQTLQDFEAIVVDDGGSDGSQAVVERFGRPEFIYHWKEHGERGAARNAGARLARGRYVNFFDSDDVLYPHHLETAARFIAEKGEPPICHFGYDVRDDALNLLRGAEVYGGNLSDRLATGNSLTFNAAFIKREICLQYPFSENPDLTGEDWSLWLRLGARFPIAYANVTTSSVIEHQARSVLTMDPEKLVLRVTNLLASLFDDPEVRRRYGAYEPQMRAAMYCYLALHLALVRAPRAQSTRYLAQAVSTWPPIVTKRSFHGALKRLIVGPDRGSRPGRQPD